MGGSGSGRPPGAKNKKPGDFIPDDTTFIDGEPAPKETKSKGGGGKKLKFTTAEISGKIDLLMSVAAWALRRDYKYTEADYTAEANGIIHTADKWPIVGYVLAAIDPLFVGFSLIKKFIKMPRTKAPEKEAGADPAAGSKVIPMR